MRSDRLPARLLRRLLLTGRNVVLFICVENAGRSLMAEAIFNADPLPGWVAVSAGTRPAARSNPRTGPMLAEIGLALPAHDPQPLGRPMMDEARVRITMGCLDDSSCLAHLKGLETRDWALPDPAGLDDVGFRRVRDEIVKRVRELRTELAGGGRAGDPRPRSAPG